MRSSRSRFTAGAWVAALAGVFATAAIADEQDSQVVAPQQQVVEPAPQPAPAPQPVYEAPAPQPVYQPAPVVPVQNNNTNTVSVEGPRWEGGYLVGQHEYHSALLIDPGALISGVVDLEYESALARWLGVSLGLSVNTYRGAFEPKAEGSFVAFGPEIGLRVHLIQPAPAGLWLGPELAVKYIAWRGANAPGSTAPVGTAEFGYDLGAAIGYNFVIDHFLLSLGVGGGFGDYGYGVYWQPRFRLGVGAAF